MIMKRKWWFVWNQLEETKHICSVMNDWHRLCVNAWTWGAHMIIYSDLWRVLFLFGIWQHVYIIHIWLWRPHCNPCVWACLRWHQWETHYLASHWTRCPDLSPFSSKCSNFLTKFHFASFCYANPPLAAMLISDLFESQTFCSVFDWHVLRQMMPFFGAKISCWENVIFKSNWRSNSCSLSF